MITREQRVEIVKNVGSLISDRHVNPANPTYDYSRWRDSLNARVPSLCDGSDADFEQQMVAALAELGTSHLTLMRGENQGVPATFSLNAGLMAITVKQKPRWMFRDVVEDGPAYRAGIENGEVLVAVNGIPIEPPAPALFTLGGPNTLVLTKFHKQEERSLIIDLPPSLGKNRPPMVEPKAVAARFLGNSVGHLRVSYFPGTLGHAFIANLNKAIDALRHDGAKRFVVDLRGNPGGGLGSLRLMSLLSAEPRPIGYSLTRRAIRRAWQKEQLPRIDRIPQGKLEQIGMALRFKVFNRDRSIALVTEHLAEPTLAGAAVLLVNSQTKSAAEMVAAFCSEHHLATIVGERTPGEVLGAVNFSLPGDYRLRMPIATWQTWEGSVIEGHGVVPNVAVDLSPEQLQLGIDSQLQAAIRVFS